MSGPQVKGLLGVQNRDWLKTFVSLLASVIDEPPNHRLNRMTLVLALNSGSQGYRVNVPCGLDGLECASFF